VVSFGSQGLYAYDFTGKLLWKKDLGSLDAGWYMDSTAQWGFASSPVLYDNKVIVQADVQKDSFIAALDANTGKELWRTARGDVPTFGTPAIAPYTAGGAKGMQVVINGWKQKAGYDLETGKELWRHKGGGDIPVPTPVVAGDLVILTSAHGGERPVMAVRTDAAGEISEGKGIQWIQENAGNYMQTPLLHNGLGYFCLDNGVLTVFQLDNGERIYQQRIGDGTTGFTSSPVAAGNRLYITNEEGHTYVLALGREYKVLGENDLGETVMASPAISEGRLFIRGRNHLFALGEKGGK
jgi:outer membrane protein assembly factor BamB